MEYNKNKLKAKAKLICELYVSLVKSKVIRIFDLNLISAKKILFYYSSITPKMKYLLN